MNDESDISELNSGAESVATDRGDGSQSRRDVLKKGVAVSGALVVGASTASAVPEPEGGRGGTGYIKNFGGFVPDGRIFKINSMNTGSLAEDFSVSCNGNGTTKTYEYSYGIRWYEIDNGCLSPSPHTTRLWVQNEKDLRVGDFYHAEAASPCPNASDDEGLSRQLHSISFGPVPNATECE